MAADAFAETPASTPLFSLIMPTYGVRDHIASAVSDVRGQTCGDWELIVVDDCTPDDSIERAREAASGDPRVRFLSHERNLGISGARNTGIEAARGAYIFFPDPDDRFEPAMLEHIEAALERHERPDVVVFGHMQRYFDGDGSFLYENEMVPSPGFWANGELPHQLIGLEEGTHLGYAWNKAYRLELVERLGLRFEFDAPLIEDFLFAAAFFRHAQSLACIDSADYLYAKRLGKNLTNEFIPNYYELHRRRIAVMRDLLDDRGALDENARETLGALYGRYILSALERTYAERAHMDAERRRAWCASVFADRLFDELVMNGRARNSCSLAVCLAVLKTRNIGAALALGKAVHAVRSRSTALYSKAKSGR